MPRPPAVCSLSPWKIAASRPPGGVTTAVGDLDGDGFADLIAAGGPGLGAVVQAFSGKTGRPLTALPFNPYPGEDFTSIGLFVAAGDVDGDGRAEVAVSPDQGCGTRVQVFSYAAGGFTRRANFFAIDDANFRGGARIAMGDVNGDGRADLVAGAGFSGGGPGRGVRAVSSAGSLLFQLGDPFAPGATFPPTAATPDVVGLDPASDTAPAGDNQTTLARVDLTGTMAPFTTVTLVNPARTEQLPEWAAMRPFALGSPDEFRPPAPPAVGSPEWLAAFNEVRTLGSATRTRTRTADEAEPPRLWADGAGTITPPGRWRQIALAGARAHNLDGTDVARILAALAVAEADAAVAVWDAKYEDGTWRPVTAIRSADRLGDPSISLDLAWSPPLTTPNHPEYVSGHSAFSRAAATVLEQFLPGLLVQHHHNRPGALQRNARVETRPPRSSRAVVAVVSRRGPFVAKPVSEEAASTGRPGSGSSRSARTPGWCRGRSPAARPRPGGTSWSAGPNCCGRPARSTCSSSTRWRRSSPAGPTATPARSRTSYSRSAGWRRRGRRCWCCTTRGRSRPTRGARPAGAGRSWRSWT